MFKISGYFFMNTCSKLFLELFPARRTRYFLYFGEPEARRNTENELKQIL